MNRPMAKPTPDLLRNVPLFSGLDDSELESLADEFNERRFSAGDTIALEGEGGLMFFVVDEGEAPAGTVAEGVTVVAVDDATVTVAVRREDAPRVAFAAARGFAVGPAIDSPIAGPAGNLEYLLLLSTPADPAPGGAPSAS